MSETSAALAALEARVAELEARIADLVGANADLAAAIVDQSKFLERLAEAATKSRGKNRVEELLERILEYLEELSGGGLDQPASEPPRRAGDVKGSSRAAKAASNGEALNGTLDAPGRRRR